MLKGNGYPSYRLLTGRRTEVLVTYYQQKLSTQTCGVFASTFSYIIMVSTDYNRATSMTFQCCPGDLYVKCRKSHKFHMGKDSIRQEEQAANHLHKQSAVFRTLKDTELAALAFLPQGRRNDSCLCPSMSLHISLFAKTHGQLGSNCFSMSAPTLDHLINCYSVPVWHESILLPSEHDANIGGVISGGVEVGVIACEKQEQAETFSSMSFY